MLSNMASSLILHKRIKTTVAKAKELRKYVEPLLTKSKTDTPHSRRVCFSYLQHNATINELFGIVANAVSERPGGYTRIIRTGNRLGDNAEMCIIELVDFNTLMLQDEAQASKRRTRRGKKKSQEVVATAPAAAAPVVEEEAPEAEEPEAPATEEAEGEEKKEE